MRAIRLNIEEDPDHPIMLSVKLFY
jgi:hypothetical protein